MSGRGDVVYALLLVQVAAGLLACVGEMLLMATPLYGLVPVVKAVVLLVIAGQLVRGRRWAIRVVLVVEWLGLAGVGLGWLLGLLPALAPSITLTGLLTEVCLPIAVIVLARRLLAPPPTDHAWMAHFTDRGMQTAHSRVGGRLR